MADEETTGQGQDTPPDKFGQQKPKQTGKSILDQVAAEVRKAKADIFKNELKELVKQREEAQKTLDLVQDKITKKIDDFDAGLV